MVLPDAEVLRHTRARRVAVRQVSGARDHSVLPHVALDVGEVSTTPPAEPLDPRRRPSVRIHTWLVVRQIQPVITPSGRLRRPGPSPAPTTQAAPRQHAREDDPYENAPPHIRRTLHASEWFHRPRTAPNRRPGTATSHRAGCAALTDDREGFRPGNRISPWSERRGGGTRNRGRFTATMATLRARQPAAPARRTPLTTPPNKKLREPSRRKRHASGRYVHKRATRQGPRTTTLAACRLGSPSQSSKSTKGATTPPLRRTGLPAHSASREPTDGNGYITLSINRTWTTWPARTTIDCRAA